MQSHSACPRHSISREVITCLVFDCEAGYQPDNGQNDVTDGSVENYDFDWGQPLDAEPLDDALTDAERTEAQHTE